MTEGGSNLGENTGSVLSDNQQAQARDDAFRENPAKLGVLHGVPVAVKDLCDIQGFSTRGGSDATPDLAAAKNSTVVQKLLDAGAVIVGKTQTHELAYGAITPQTRNPVSPGFVVGGSSGGSAAALAADMVYGAVGSDTAGSIRIPAALTGLVGMKPTYGRIGRTGSLALSWSLDHFGPMARSVADVALLLEALSGYDSADNGSAQRDAPRFIEHLDPTRTSMRIGLPKNFFFEGIDPVVRSAALSAVESLASAGAEIVEVEIPFADMYRASTYGIFLPEAASYHEMLLKASGDKLGEATRAFLELGLTLPAHFYIQSQRARSIIMHGWNALFNTVDVVVGPTLPALAVPIGETDIDWGGRTEAVIDAYMRFCCVSNLTGLPSLTVPSGQDERGRTAGLQIIGPAFKETACLQVGALLESVTAQLAETNLERKNL